MRRTRPPQEIDVRKQKPTERWHRRRAKLEAEAQAYGGAHRCLGNTQLRVLRGLKGSTFGPASEFRILSEDESAAIEAQMREEGKL